MTCFNSVKNMSQHKLAGRAPHRISIATLLNLLLLQRGVDPSSEPTLAAAVATAAAAALPGVMLLPAAAACWVLGQRGGEVLVTVDLHMHGQQQRHSTAQSVCVCIVPLGMLF
jgi:hypothetical protein